MTPATGSFELSAATVIEAPQPRGDAADAANYLVGLWKRTNAIALAVRHGAASGGDSTIRFERRAGFAPEAYRLEVRPHRITVSASTGAGLFYGAVTLWQLLPAGVMHGSIGAQTIIDEPRFRWRGLLLDSSRHFQSPAFVRSMIDWMAWHKLNVLHWHLTDDQGWRLQIRRYPRLTEVGAWRAPAVVPGAPALPRYGGFYNQTEVREIVAYATARHVQIVPEIDMPGHAQAAIAAYPELGSLDAKPQLTVSDRWGVHSHLFNLEPGTFDFLQNVLAEVMELFPSPYIHIGGDEAVKDEWNASAQVQARAAALGIHDAASLQTYFSQKLGRFLETHGRRAVGWDEILQPGLARGAVVMAWHGAAAAHAAALAGNDTVLSPAHAMYFDNRQSALSIEPTGRFYVNSLKKVYSFEPHDPQLTDLQQRHILGLQANLWSEHIPTEARMEWMALPRAAAVAEIGWSPQQRNWTDFLARLTVMSARYRAFGLHYADSAYGIDARFRSDGDAIAATLANLPELLDPALGVSIRYTLDGQEPSASSSTYTGALKLPVGTMLRAATFLAAERASRTQVFALDAHAATRRSSNELELCSDGVGLLLEPPAGQPPAGGPAVIDIMNPCWIYRDVDMSAGPTITAAVTALPFNYELGADTAKIRIGDNRTSVGELEVHADSCDGSLLVAMPLPPAVSADYLATLPPQKLPALAGRHDLCVRFARPALDPIWAIDWLETGR